MERVTEKMDSKGATVFLWVDWMMLDERHHRNRGQERRGKDRSRGERQGRRSKA